MGNQRMLRVNELLRREIGNMIEQCRFKDGLLLISVRSVTTTPELRHANILVSVLPETEENNIEAIRLLNDERKHFQANIAKNITLKNTPILSFEVDKKVAAADNVLNLIQQLEEEEKLNNDNEENLNDDEV